MRGKTAYVNAVVELGRFLSNTNQEIADIEEQLQRQFDMTGNRDPLIEDKLYTKKAAALNQFIIAAESFSYAETAVTTQPAGFQ